MADESMDEVFGENMSVEDSAMDVDSIHSNEILQGKFFTFYK